MALLAVSEGCLLGDRTNDNPISKSMHSKIYIYVFICVSYQTRPGCVLEGSTCSLCVGIPYPKQNQTQKMVAAEDIRELQLMPSALLNPYVEQ